MKDSRDFPFKSPIIATFARNSLDVSFLILFVLQTMNINLVVVSEIRIILTLFVVVSFPFGFAKMSIVCLSLARAAELCICIWVCMESSICPLVIKRFVMFDEWYGMVEKIVWRMHYISWCRCAYRVWMEIGIELRMVWFSFSIDFFHGTWCSFNPYDMSQCWRECFLIKSNQTKPSPTKSIHVWFGSTIFYRFNICVCVYVCICIKI